MCTLPDLHENDSAESQRKPAPKQTTNHNKKTTAIKANPPSMFTREPIKARNTPSGNNIRSQNTYVSNRQNNSNKITKPKTVKQSIKSNIPAVYFHEQRKKRADEYNNTLVDTINGKNITKKDVRDALVTYVGGGYQDINTYLRTKASKGENAAQEVIKQNTTGTDPDTHLANVKHYVDALTVASKRDEFFPQLTKDLTVYRGCTYIMIENHKGNALEKKNNGAIKVDNIIVETGMMSTSKKIERAQRSAPAGGALLTIHAPAGIRAHEVTSETEMRTITGKKLRKEDEVLFGAGQRIKITNVDPPQDPETDVYMIEGELQ